MKRKKPKRQGSSKSQGKTGTKTSAALRGSTSGVSTPAVVSNKSPIKLSIITPTHNPQWIAQTWQSIKQQSFDNWQWVVFCNGTDAPSVAGKVQEIIQGDERVDVHIQHMAGGIGALKAAAFGHGDGEVLIELDHDDLLAPGALMAIAQAVQEHPEIDFFYSDWIDFEGDKGQGTPLTYGTEETEKKWKKNGFKFYNRKIGGVRPGTYKCVRSFEPSAMGLSTILWSPNHVRVWRKDAYIALGGHDRRFDIADDHELLIRTYLHCQMHHIPEPLYLYRYTGVNSWASRVQEIAKISARTGSDNLEALVLREASLKGLPVYDLGGGITPRKDWIAVDKKFDIDPNLKFRPKYYPCDLTKYPWPWDDNSVAAFRAADFLEHLPDKMQTMSEIWRCLMPGGWLLSSTPSTDGRGAFQDPTHVSFWNSNAFWYWTRPATARYIRNDFIRFAEVALNNHFPTDWHKLHNIVYVVANLIAIKDEYSGPRPAFK